MTRGAHHVIGSPSGTFSNICCLTPVLQVVFEDDVVLVVASEVPELPWDSSLA